jgi:predicted dehydrogenase
VVTSRADEVAARYPRAEVLAGADELWDRVDLVVISTPNRAHVPLAREALRHDRAVVVDKPLAVSAADARSLLEEGGRLTVFQNRRWDGDFLTLRRLLAEGALGDVTRLESRFERFRPSTDTERWRELADPEEGGGLLLDLGAHLVDQALQLFGPVRTVYAEIDRRRPGAVVDDDVFLALEHEGGEHSHLWMSATAALHGPRFAVSGLRAGFAVDGLDVQEAQLDGGMTPADEGYGVAEARGRLVDEQGARDVELERGDYPAFYAQVAAWLRDDAPPPVDPADSVAGLEILDAARAAAPAGQTVTVR